MPKQARYGRRLSIARSAVDVNGILLLRHCALHYAQGNRGKMKSPLRHLRRSPNNKKKSKKVVVVDALPQNANVNVISLGVGTFPTDGEITFNPSSSIATPPRKDTADTVESTGRAGAPAEATADYARKSSTFMRMADLEVLATDLSPVKEEQSSERHYDHPSVDPPPGVDRDPKERWVALDAGTGTGTGGSNHAPVAPYAVDALCMGGYNSAMNPTMWKADKKTEKTLRECQEWSSLAWSKGGGGAVVPPPKGSAYEKSVLIWSGQFQHGLYGTSHACFLRIGSDCLLHTSHFFDISYEICCIISCMSAGGDLPTVRAMGLVNMSPRAIVDLLVDSSRVHEYNKMSLGRTDVLVLQNNFEEEGSPFPGITKVVQSESQPPLLRKRLQFVTLMHARRLEGGNGYIIVSRAVTRGEEPVDVKPGDILRSEILMGINIILDVEGDENRAIMINQNHIRSPMVPLFIAKKIGLAAAEGFFDDIRALT